MSKVDFEIEIPTDLYEDLKRMAENANVPVEEFISFALEEELKKMMDKHEIT